MDVFIDGEILANQVGKKPAHIERILGLPQRSLKDKKFLDLPETQALLKIILVCPFVLEVAEHNFDQEKANLILCREYFNMKLKETK